MATNGVDGKWLDFYALLEVPVNASEDQLRKRIGKAYAEASANSDHRDLAKRHYYQALVERVLPQCRRVLLDPEWRAKYDRQHILHSINDPSAQDYVTFIASARGTDTRSDATELPQRVREEIKIARAVVSTVETGEVLELLPARALSAAELPPAASEPDAALSRHAAWLAGMTPDPAGESETDSIPASSPAASSIPAQSLPGTAPVPAPPATPPVAAPAPNSVYAQAGQFSDKVETRATIRKPAPAEPAKPAAVQPPGTRSVTDAGTALGSRDPEAHRAAPAAASSQPATNPADSTAEAPVEVRAQVITAAQAADIRRRRASNPGAPLTAEPAMDGSLSIPSRNQRGKGKVSRVLVGDETGVRPQRRRVLSPTSLNLMVAIAGVLLTITIQRFAATPADATSAQRVPLFIAYPSSLEPVMSSASEAWENTSDGAGVNIVLQEVDAQVGVNRVLGEDGATPDMWIPSDSLWSDRYNDLAPGAKRRMIQSRGSVVETPVVLVARDDHASVLEQRFPDHIIPSWDALRDAIASGAPGHFGLTDPDTSGAGAVARYSMAHEWTDDHGLSLSAATGNNALWKWMDGFESNVPAVPASTNSLVKDLVWGTTGNYWWAVAYESDALGWMAQGKPLQIYYLPRTDYADHPLFDIDRLGAPSEALAARASFEAFMHSTAIQTSLLRHGYRPTEIGLDTDVSGNPFIDPRLRQRGVRIEGLPRADRIEYSTLKALCDEWARRYGG